MLKPAFAPAIAGRCLRREFMNNLIWRSVTCRPGKKSVLPKGKTEPCSRRRYRQTRPEGRSPPLRGCLRSGYARPSTPPQRHSHPVCRAILTLIVALDQEGANVATRNIYTHRHLDLDHCRHWLQKIRAKDVENGIMVVPEGLFSMDSDTPDIAALQDLCHEYGATLLVDVAHDLGSLGEDGRGHIGIQKMLGKVDLVMGSFSKTFASNGGFVACRNRAVKEYLRFYSPSATFSNALSQAQAAVVLKAFEIVESAEGRGLRRELMTNVLNLRATLTEQGMGFYGDPSAIVCVKVGTERVARLVSRQLPDLGLLANLVEYPAVSKGRRAISHAGHGKAL